MGDLSGKTAAVIGGGRGLGRAAALALAAHGAGVAIASRTAAELDAVAAEISRTGGRAGTVVADASQEPDAARIVGAALRPMLAAGRGLIVNVASRAGITGAANVAAYTAAKAAVIGFSRALALEVKAQGVRVTCLAPADGYADAMGRDALLRSSASPVYRCCGRSGALPHQAPRGHAGGPRSCRSRSGCDTMCYNRCCLGT